MSAHAETPDEFLAALDEAIRRSGVERYRYLTLEHPDPSVREGYRGLVRGLAAGPPAASPAAGVAESVRLVGAMKRCPYRARDKGCGCSGSRCALRPASIVSHLDCFACIRAYG
jgi:hypothetical protein